MVWLFSRRFESSFPYALIL